jgi:DNA-binding NarL/FixJ family response regulator
LWQVSRGHPDEAEAVVLTETSPLPEAHVLVLDEDPTRNLDALATAVAIFGEGRFNLLYAEDQDGLHLMADRLAGTGTSAVIVVDVDDHPAPKQLLANVTEAGFPVAVVSDGDNEAIHDHALSVGAAAYLPTSLPARELVFALGSLPQPRADDTLWR